jgi:probable HAF family extracellular repeat protein
MRSKCLMFVTAITLFTALAIPVRLAAQDKQDHNHKLPHYTITVLGTLGGTFSAATALNNRGWEAGNSLLSGDQNVHAFLWRKGVMTDLGTLGGPNSFTSEDPVLNDSVVVVGFSDTSIPDPNGEDVCGDLTHLICLPYAWQNGVITALPLLGGNNGQATGINNRGQMVGISETPNPDPTCSLFSLQVEAVVWQHGQGQELPPFPGDPDGVANAINEKGDAVGGTGCATGTLHPVLWQNGTVIDLGNLGGARGNVAFDVNNKGQVVGQSDLPGDTTHHGFLWTKHDGMQDLGTLYGLPVSLANAINDKGQVVGFSQDANGDFQSTVASLWQDGVLTDLNTLVPPNSPFLVEALGINDRGQIAGYGLLSNGDVHGFLLTPCDEQHAGNKGCEDGTGSAAPVAGLKERPRIALPESLRQRLQQRPGFRRFGTGPAPDQKQELRSGTDDLEGADHLLASPNGIGLHRGYCQIGRNTDDLTGLCVSKGRSSCSIKRSLGCPQGQEAKWGRIVGCGIANEQIVDPTRPCSF